MSVTVFYSSVSSSVEVKKNQKRIFDVLDSKKIPHKDVDICQCTEDKDLMRELVGNPTALAPQICNGDIYCGDYTAFDNAVEMETLNEFLRI